MSTGFILETKKNIKPRNKDAKNVEFVLLIPRVYQCGEKWEGKGGGKWRPLLK